jgi:hypothetical protein
VLGIVLIVSLFCRLCFDFSQYFEVVLGIIVFAAELNFYFVFTFYILLLLFKP